MISIRKTHGTVLLLAVILAIVGWRFFQRPPEVGVVHPERREVVELVIGSGRLRAVRQSDIGSEAAGTVEKVAVDEGDRVRTGQPLIMLRRTEVERQLEQARLASRPLGENWCERSAARCLPRLNASARSWSAGTARVFWPSRTSGVP